MKINTSSRISPVNKTIAPLLLLAALWLGPIAIAHCDPIPDHPRVNQVNARAENQQARIAQGVKSGNLTAGQTANLESREASVKTEEHNMRASDNGHLTTQDQ